MGAFAEGTPIQYSFAVPHDLPGLIELFGNRSKFETALDLFFYNFTAPVGDENAAHGVFGGHTQGNEVGHHIPYLYNYVGTQWKTQKIMNKLQDMYTTGRDGIPGNDDVGKMSAWHVWSALGLYPVDPCSLKYAIGR